LASTNDGDAVAAPAAEADCSAACTQPVTITICALPADEAPDCVSDCAVAPALSATASAPAKKTCLVMISLQVRIAEPLRRIYASRIARHSPSHCSASVHEDNKDRPPTERCKRCACDSIETSRRCCAARC
jgi:hypothetical protein